MKTRGIDYQLDVELTLEEAYTGIKKALKYPSYEYCNICAGSGSAPGEVAGSDFKSKRNEAIKDSSHKVATCPRCQGEGSVPIIVCPECSGRGKTQVTRSIDVNIPAGVDNDSQLRVRGEGQKHSSGNGDLFILIKIKNHPVFERKGQDLHMCLPTSFANAVLGGHEKVKTLKEEILMKIPEGTQSDKVFRMRGQGARVNSSWVKGDL